MSVVGHFTVTASAFALAHALSSSPDVTVEFDQIVAHSSDWVMPFLWASDGDFEAFDAALDADESVADWTVTDDFGTTRLYQVTWAQHVIDAVDWILDHQGTILTATGQDDRWRLRVRFVDRTHLATFQQHFDEHGTVRVRHLSAPGQPHTSEHGLTDKQRSALLAAYEAGYFERPRTATATDLADEFGVSQQAFSDRLRRGTAALIEEALVTGEQSATD